MRAIGLPLGGEVRAVTATNHVCPTRGGPASGSECPQNAFSMVGQARDARQNVQRYCL
jgi:hypothetical protein